MAELTSYVLDTSAYSAFNRGDKRLRPWLAAAYDIQIPIIVTGELRAGFAAGSKRRENEALLRRFLDMPNVFLLPLSLATTEHFANLFLQLRQKGIAISTNDLWIAALSLEHGLPILTLDKDFCRIEGLQIISLE